MKVDNQVINSVIEQVLQERKRQDRLWGIQDHNDDRWYAILGEEFGELGKAINEQTDLTKELIQCIAVLVAWFESIGRRTDRCIICGGAVTSTLTGGIRVKRIICDSKECLEKFTAK
jgi:NTP pyrophosphatase (non-canonical NTP hydrolase)